MTLYCPACGKPNTDSATHCVSCKHELQGRQKPKFRGTMMMAGITPENADPSLPQPPDLGYQPTMLGPMTPPGGGDDDTIMEPSPFRQDPSMGDAATIARPATPGFPGPSQPDLGATAMGGFAAAPGSATPPGGFAQTPAGGFPQTRQEAAGFAQAAAGGFAQSAHDAGQSAQSAAGGFAQDAQSAAGGFAQSAQSAAGGFAQDAQIAAGGFAQSAQSAAGGAAASAQSAAGGFAAAAPGAAAGFGGAPPAGGGFGGTGEPPPKQSKTKLIVGVLVGCFLISALACGGAYWFVSSSAEDAANSMMAAAHRFPMSLALSSIKQSCTADPTGAGAANSVHAGSQASIQGHLCEITDATVTAFGQSCDTGSPCANSSILAGTADEQYATAQSLDAAQCTLHVSGSAKLIWCDTPAGGRIVHAENLAGVQ